MGRSNIGIEIRESSIRVVFALDGQVMRERLTINGKAMPPTQANIKHATRLVAEVRAAISNGIFSWSRYFPESKHAKAESDRGGTAESVGNLLDTWLDTRGTLAPGTKSHYNSGVRFWKGLLGVNTPVADITHKMLAAKIGKYPWPSAKTHNNIMISLRGAMGLEYRGTASVNNPMVGIQNMTVVKKLPDPLTANERDKVLADIRQHYEERVYAYFLWMFYTGMRPEEAIALRWSDVDMTREAIRVQRVRTFKGSEREGSKTHSVRDVDLLPQAMEALAIMRKYTFMLQAERMKEQDTAADIFQNPVTRRHWHDERSQRDNYWKPAMKRLGIRWRTAYNTRHTFASAALMTGVKPAYIAAQLGHSLKMLLERYAKWIPEDDNGSSKAALARAMGSSTPQSLPKMGAA